MVTIFLANAGMRLSKIFNKSTKIGFNQDTAFEGYEV